MASWTCLTMGQIIACCLMAPSHNPTRCWLLMTSICSFSLWPLSIQVMTYVDDENKSVTRLQWVMRSIGKALYVQILLILTEGNFIIPSNNEVVGGVYWFLSVRLSVRLSVCPSVRLSRLPCPLCNIYNSGWIFSILATNDHYHERVCRTQWPLTLTYIFKVI